MGARHRRDADDMAYRTYVTEGLRGVCRLLGSGGMPSWAGLVRPVKPMDKRSGRQVAASVNERLAKLGGCE